MAVEHASSLRCTQGHCFDLSAKGYVNFIPNKGVLKGYDRDFFENRRVFLGQGFYDHIADAVWKIGLEKKVIVDAGCGEGFYSRRGEEAEGRRMFAFDYAKEAIKIAARGRNSICWMVADLTNIPLGDGIADCIFNIFSPANYGEFVRVLKQDGLLIKAIPSRNHMAELRSALQGAIRKEDYSNQSVKGFFSQNFKLLECQTVGKTIPVSKEQVKQLVGMTPLAFHVDKEKLDCIRIGEITIEADILIGRRENFTKI